MKALAVFPSSHQIKVIDHPEPTVQSPTDVKLKMLEIGICGTDKEICQFEYGTPPAGSDYLILGHESLGRVVEVGGGVKSLKVGDLVVPMVRRPCDRPDCVACRAGRQDFCYTGEFTERGIKGRHGYMTELVVDDEKYMNLVPPQSRPIAVLTEPLTIAEKAIEQLMDIQNRLPWACPTGTGKGPQFCHKALVLGAGPVGLLGAMALALRGFQTFVYSKGSASSPRGAVATGIGATYISADQIPPDQLADKIGAIDVVYEAVGASSLAFEVMKELGTNGVFIFTGVPGRKGPIQVDTDLIMRDFVLKNQVVYGTVNAGKQAFADAISDLAAFSQKWPAAAAGVITGKFPIEKAPDLALGKIDGIKNVVAMG